MADEATVAATTTETTVPVVTEVPAVEAGEAKDTGKPAKPMTALERATAAVEKATAKADTKADAKDGKAAKTDEAKADDEKPAEERKPEPEKVEPRLSRGLAILAAREEKVRQAEAALKTARIEHETKLAAETADLQLVREVKAALAKGGKAAALKVLGIDLKTGVEELSRSYEEPTQEDIARRVIAEELDARQKADAAAKAKEDAEKAEREKAQEQVSLVEFVHKAQAVIDSNPDGYPRLEARLEEKTVTPHNLYVLGKILANETGRNPTPAEILAAAEKRLEENDNKYQARVGSKLKKPEPAAPAKPEPTPKAKPEAPAKQQSRRPTRTASPLDRAEQALKRLNIQ